DLSNLRLVMLAAVLYSATAFGLGPAIFASLLSVVIYDYFFVDPSLTFSATEPEDALTTAIFIAVAILVSNLVARLHREAQAAQRRERYTDALFQLSREIAGSTAPRDVMRTIVERADQTLRARSILLLPR